MPLSCGSFSLDDVSSKTALCQAPAAFPFRDRTLYQTRPEPVTKATALSEQLAFFSGFSGAPQGLRYAAEFISPSTEQELIAHIASLPLQPFQFGQYEGKRRVASFGFRYDYTLRRLQEAEPIPEWLGPIISQVEAFGGRSTQVRQILCTEYDTGVGIGWRVIATSRISTGCSACRWAQPASFASAVLSATSGSALRSMPSRARST
jgi:hypothetical protein